MIVKTTKQIIKSYGKLQDKYIPNREWVCLDSLKKEIAKYYTDERISNEIYDELMSLCNSSEQKGCVCDWDKFKPQKNGKCGRCGGAL